MELAKDCSPDTGTVALENPGALGHLTVTDDARGLAQLVRATVSKTVGREFESLSPCQSV